MTHIFTCQYEVGRTHVDSRHERREGVRILREREKERREREKEKRERERDVGSGKSRRFRRGPDEGVSESRPRAL